MITVNIKRYDPETDKHYTESYDIEASEKMKVLDALKQINDNYDANIAYRYSCRAGQCGSCAIKINGKPKLACKAEIEDNDLLEPLDFMVLKDLIVDRTHLDEKTRKLNLYLGSEDCGIKKVEPDIIHPEEYAKADKLRSCIECYSCLSVCPVIKKTSNFVGPYYMRNISNITFDPRDDESRGEESIESGLYCCTSCGECGKTCPKEINIYGNAIEKLREQIFKEKLGPLPAHKKIREMVRDTGRSVEPGDEKYPEGLIKAFNENKKFDKKPKIAFFTGCMIDYKLPNIGASLIKILEKLGYEVDIPDTQVCCGSPLLRTGQTDVIPELVKKNYETFKDYDIILTVCAGCGSTLKNDYPEYGVNLNVMDITEFLVDKLNPEDMKKLDLKVTYHDPCHLARGQGITEQPRKILNNMNGVEFIEMEHADTCCGAGGGVRSGIPHIAESLAKDRVDEIKELDVDYVITICPFCEYNIQDELNKEGVNAPVLNIIQLLEKAYID